MERTIERKGMVWGDVKVTLRNDGYTGFSIIATSTKGNKWHKRFDTPSEAKAYALKAFGARF